MFKFISLIGLFCLSGLYIEQYPYTTISFKKSLMRLIRFYQIQTTFSILVWFGLNLFGFYRI